MKTKKRPRIHLSEVDDTTIETVLNEIKNSQSVMAFIRTKAGELKFLHTGLGKNDYTTLLLFLGRHLGLLNLVKLCVKHAELYNESEGKQGFNFTGKALEYLEWKKNNFNQIKTNDIL